MFSWRNKKNVDTFLSKNGSNFELYKTYLECSGCSIFTVFKQ